MNELINWGTLSLNKDESKSGPKTVVVLGIARSGTTMVAKILQELGVYLGDKDSPVSEDMSVSNLLEKDRNMEAFDQLVAERNEAHSIWGWKRPEAFRYIKHFEGHIRNPHFIFLYRDPLAIGVREKTSMQADVFQAMTRVQKRYTAINRYVQNTEHACLLVSYEKALLKSKALIDSLVEYLDLDVSDETKSNALKAIQTDNQEYLKRTSRKKRPQGVLKSTKDGILKGWAFNGRNRQKQNVDLYVNGRLLKTLVANEYKAALEKKSIGDGKHAFTYDFSEKYNSSPAMVELDLRFQGTEISLNNCPYKLFKPVFFMHIPKVGGTSLRAMLYPKFGADNIFPNGKQLRESKGYPSPQKLGRIPARELKNVSLVFGHYPFICKDVLHKKFYTACMFRKPMDRMISSMFHMKRRHPEMSMREIFDTKYERIVSTQIKYFADESFDDDFKSHADIALEAEDFQRAKSNVQTLDFIGLNEDYAKSMELLNAIFNFDIGEPVKRNVASNKDMSLFDDQLLADLKSAAKEEEDLYELVVAEYRKRIESAGLKTEI